MELKITEITSVDGYLNSMAMCEDWMSYRLARLAITLCKDAQVEPTVAIVTDYVSNYSFDGYLIAGKPGDAEFHRALVVNNCSNIEMINQAKQEALSSWNNR